MFQTGVFYVIAPVLVGDELLDAVAMGTKAEELVRSGNQYIAIDLSSLDYIYSDSINRFINLNRSILDINGRIVIVAPHPKVYELLEKAGVLNFIKVCRSEDDLMRISEMISPAPAVEEIPVPAPVQQQAPVIEQPVPTPVQQQAHVIEQPVPTPPPAQPESSPFEQAPVVEEEISFEAAPDVTPVPVVEEEAPFEFSAVEDEPFNVDNTETPAFDTAESVQDGFDDSVVVEESNPIFHEEETKMDDLFKDDSKHGKGKALGIFILLAIIILGGLGAMYFTGNLGSTTGNTSDDNTVQAVIDTVPETEEPVTDTTETEDSTEVEEPVVEETPAPTPTRRTTQRTTTTNTRRSTPRVTDKITLTSVPAGARVFANGDFVGTAPHTWNNPDAYGDIEFVFRKEGYSDSKRRFEYLGGSESIRVTLTQEARTTQATQTTRATATPIDNSEAEAEAARQAQAQRDAQTARDAETARQAQADSDAAAARQAQALRDAETARQAQADSDAEAARQAQALRDAETARQAQADSDAEAARQAQALRDAETARQAAAQAEREAEAQRQAQANRDAEAARQAQADREAEEARAAEAARQASVVTKVFLTSLPPAVDIYENGVLIGKTNVAPITTTPGAHTFEFRKGDITVTKSFTFREGQNSAPPIRMR